MCRCVKGKAKLPAHHRLPHSDNKHSNQPLERLHYDVKTINKRSWGNSLYAGLVVDDYILESYFVSLYVLRVIRLLL